MSEYQYYEFRAVDRPLDQGEMDELRALSTRAEITSTSFTNTYHWGDFKGDPASMMRRYFDAFVYVANWGTHRLMLRVPRKLIDVGAAEAYCDEEGLTLDVRKDHVVLEFRSELEEPEDWDEGESWMPSLIPLRDEILRGDLRTLYLGWLATLPRAGWESDDEGDDDRPEPPVPPGLAKLSGPLRSLATFLRVEDELIEAAAEASDGEPPAGPTRDELALWIKGLPASAKDAYLVRLLTEPAGPAIRNELSHRFRDEAGPGGPRPAEGRRTVAQLLEARDALVEAKRRKAAEVATKERARRDREEAEARAKHLDGLARRESAAWGEVDDLIATKKPKDYDAAVALLADLREVAGRSGRKAETEARIRDLRQRHSSKPSLLARLDKALGKP